jgi:hypothetical protein
MKFACDKLKVFLEKYYREGRSKGVVADLLKRRVICSLAAAK